MLIISGILVYVALAAIYVYIGRKVWFYDEILFKATSWIWPIGVVFIILISFGGFIYSILEKWFDEEQN